MNSFEIADFIALEDLEILVQPKVYDQAELALASAKLKVQSWLVLEFNSVTAICDLNLGSLLPLEVQRWEILLGSELINCSNLNLVE